MTGSDDSSSESGSESEKEPEFNRFTRGQFKQVLESWLAVNHDRVVAAYQSGPGGWELWLHVELLLAVKAKDPKADIQREPGGYAQRGLRADLVLNARVKNVSTCIIEIKTEGMAQQANAFWKGVSKDVDKGTDLSKELLKQQAEPLAIGIFLSGDAWKASESEVQDIRRIGKYIGCYYGIG
jgi:hypothetical protein